MRKMQGLRYAVAAICLGTLVLGGCAKSTGTTDEPRDMPRQEPTRDQPTRPERPMDRDGDRLDIQNLSLDQLNRMELLRNIYFDFDKSNLKPAAIRTLRENGDFLREYPTVKVLIEGHCDERGTNEYNLALGERRASSARSYLMRIGIDPARLDTISYGEERPADPRHNEEAWARNRRAHFRIVAR